MLLLLLFALLLSHINTTSYLPYYISLIYQLTFVRQVDRWGGGGERNDEHSSSSTVRVVNVCMHIFATAAITASKVIIGEIWTLAHLRMTRCARALSSLTRLFFPLSLSFSFSLRVYNMSGPAVFLCIKQHVNAVYAGSQSRGSVKRHTGKWQPSQPETWSYFLWYNTRCHMKERPPLSLSHRKEDNKSQQQLGPLFMYVVCLASRFAYYVWCNSRGPLNMYGTLFTSRCADGKDYSFMFFF